MKKQKVLCLSIAAALLLAFPLVGCKEKKDKDDSNTSGSNSSGSQFSYSADIDENGYWQGVTALDFVTMFDYEKLSIPSEVHKITDAALQEQVELVLAEFAESTQVKDRAVKDGDSVNMDYVGSVDGVEFPNGSTEGKGTDVTAGGTDYIDDFLTQIIGHKPGETFNVNVTFPEVYPSSPDLAGKPAVFVTTINYITEKTNPELTDAFVKENLSEYGWNTVTEMKNQMRSDMKENAIKNYIYKYIDESVEVSSVPESMVKALEGQMVAYYQRYADDKQQELDVFLSTNNIAQSKDELIEKSREQNEKMARGSLVVQAVAEKMGIIVTEDDLLHYVQEEAGADNYESFEADYGLPYLKQSAMSHKVIHFIADNATLS